MELVEPEVTIVTLSSKGRKSRYNGRRREFRARKCYGVSTSGDSGWKFILRKMGIQNQSLHPGTQNLFQEEGSLFGYIIQL